MTRRTARALVALVFFVVVGVYRFNALGGALGGFDNDHFLHLVYGKQLQMTGEQPVRDYLDSALQGAYPSVTYELSAAAQRLLGNNLRSDGILTTGAVALGAAMTWLAASRVAWWPWALVCALLSALVSPRLYGYPKVVTTAAVAWLVTSYAAAPSRAKLAAFAVCTVVSFLFRHDYAVYAGVGFVVVIASVHARERALLARNLMTYGGLSAACAAPSLLWVQYYVGLGRYLSAGWELAARESGKTRINSWPVPEWLDASSTLDALVHPRNGEVFLYYAVLILPLLALGYWWHVRRADPPAPGALAVVALAIMSLVLWRTLIRGNLEARFGDVAPPVAVIGALLLTYGTRRGLGDGTVTWLARSAASWAVLAVTTASVFMVGNVWRELDTGKFYDLRIGSLTGRAAYVSSQLVASPARLRDMEDSGMQAPGYLHRCTKPTDRVFVFANYPETAYFAERPFAGGRAAWVPGFYSDEYYSRHALAKLEGESVPIALVEPDETSELWERFPLVADHLRRRYEDRGQLMMRGHPLRVLVEKDRVPTGTSPQGLPCFG